MSDIETRDETRTQIHGKQDERLNSHGTPGKRKRLTYDESHASSASARLLVADKSPAPPPGGPGSSFSTSHKIYLIIWVKTHCTVN